MKLKEFCKAALPDALICIVDGIFNGRTMSDPYGPRYWIDSDYAENEISKFKIIHTDDGDVYAVSFKAERVIQVSIDIQVDADDDASLLQAKIYRMLSSCGYDVRGIGVNQSWSLEQYDRGLNESHKYK